MRVGEISTERLILRHSDQDRDGWKFLMMLEEEGDFRIFTGVEYSEKYRDDFLILRLRMEIAVIILCFQRRILKNLLDMRDFIQVASGETGMKNDMNLSFMCPGNTGIKDIVQRQQRN